MKRFYNPIGDWWRDCKISQLKGISLQSSCSGYNLPSGIILQKIVATAKNFLLQQLVSGCSFFETLQTISNGQNLYWNDLKPLLNPKRHVFTNWDISLHKRHDLVIKSHNCSERYNDLKIVYIYSLNLIGLVTCSG